MLLGAIIALFLFVLASPILSCEPKDSSYDRERHSTAPSVQRISSESPAASTASLASNTISASNSDRKNITVTPPPPPPSSSGTTLSTLLTANSTTRAQQTTEVPAVNSGDKVLICYYGTWAVYRPGNGKYPVENIDPFLCTHVVYSFAGLGYDNKIRPLDPWNDLPDNYGKGAFIRFVNLKKLNPKLKTLIAIGGWNEGSVKYSTMAANPSARQTFVQSVVDLLEKYQFDGLDVDWEYPAARGGKAEDRQNFIDLLKDLRSALAPKNLLLTAAVSAGKWTIDPSYDVSKVSEYLDYINVMCYDYHGGWETRTGHNAPLFARPNETGMDALSNVNFSINYWLSKGASPSKLVLGMATYGRSFTLEKPEENGVYANAPQKGQAGPYTREAGSLGFNEICEMQKKGGWTVVRDPYYMSPYAYSGRQWVGYDDVESITLKTRLINKLGLAGGMIWSLETDDFLGSCYGIKYPLLNTIKKELAMNNRDLPDPPLSEPVKTLVSTSTNTPTTTSITTTTTTKKPIIPTSISTLNWPFKYSTRSSTSTTASPLSDDASKTSAPSRFSTEISPSTTTKVTESNSSTSNTPILISSSTTSPSSSTQPAKADDKIVCKSIGMFRNPQDCKKFYRCVELGFEGRFSMYEYECPQDTVFDSATQICLWPNSVPECRNYYSQNEILGGNGRWNPIIKRK